MALESAVPTKAHIVLVGGPGTGKTHIATALGDDQLAAEAIAARVAPSRLELIRPSLEDVFVEIVSQEPMQEQAA